MTVHGNCFHTFQDNAKKFFKNAYMLIGRCTAAEILQRLKQTYKHNRATKLYANFECASGWKKRKTTTSTKVIQSTLQQSRGPEKPLGCWIQQQWLCVLRTLPWFLFPPGEKNGTKQHRWPTTVDLGEVVFFFFSNIFYWATTATQMKNTIDWRHMKNTTRCCGVACLVEEKNKE